MSAADAAAADDAAADDDDGGGFKCPLPRLHVLSSVVLHAPSQFVMCPVSVSKTSFTQIRHRFSCLMSNAFLIAFDTNCKNIKTMSLSRNYSRHAFFLFFYNPKTHLGVIRLKFSLGSRRSSYSYVYFHGGILNRSRSQLIWLSASGANIPKSERDICEIWG